MEEIQNNIELSEVKNKKINRIIFLLGIIIVILLFICVFLILKNNKDDNANYNENATTNDYKNEQESRSTQDSNDVTENKENIIKHIGIDLDYYNPETQKAGLIEFTDEPLGEYNMPYFDYGFQVAESSAGQARKNPQPTFIVPLGTKVHSLIDGVVVNVPKLYSNDYSIHVSPSENSPLIFELEHVINPLVKKGDKVMAGQIVAEVSDYDAKNYSGYGLFEIGILKGGNPPKHICPFLYLDESIKEETYKKLNDFYSAWNNFKGEKVYDENLKVPGCIVQEEIEG